MKGPEVHLNNIVQPEEVGHDHVRTKSGRVAPYTILYKINYKSRSKALKTVLNVKAS